MQLKQRINAFITLGRSLKIVTDTFSSNEDNTSDTKEGKFVTKMKTGIVQAEHNNGWFTIENILFSLENWSKALSEENLTKWVSNYNLSTSEESKTVALIMAGNIPLVGFHDFLSVLISGNKALMKLSSQDKILLPIISEYLIEVEAGFQNSITFSEGRLKDFDAVIATGSNNTSRYFDYYFGKYPNIIRKNRNSVCVLTGNETTEQLENLSDDIFRYFGLGCRNVSKLYVPKNYDFEMFFKAMFKWKEIIHNHKYINNYDYNKAVYLMDSFPLLDNEYMLLKEDKGLSSPISILFTEYYENETEMKKLLSQNKDAIQCVVSESGLPNEISFGKTQHPALWDYADGVDTIEFLSNLTK